MTEEEKKLPQWIIERLSELSEAWYSETSSQSSYWISSELEKQKYILLSPKLPSGTGGAFDFYYSLRKNGFSQEEIKEIFQHGEGAKCLEEHKINFKQLISNEKKFNEKLSEAIKTIVEITEYDEREAIEELVRQLEEYGETKPFWPK